MPLLKSCQKQLMQKFHDEDGVLHTVSQVCLKLNLKQLYNLQCTMMWYTKHNKTIPTKCSAQVTTCSRSGYSIFGFDKRLDGSWKNSMRFFFFLWCAIPFLLMEARESGEECRETAHGRRKKKWLSFSHIPYPVPFSVVWVRPGHQVKSQRSCLVE